MKGRNCHIWREIQIILSEFDVSLTDRSLAAHGRIRHFMKCLWVQAMPPCSVLVVLENIRFTLLKKSEKKTNCQYKILQLEFGKTEKCSVLVNIC